jgi:hypothetical protein
MGPYMRGITDGNCSSEIMDNGEVFEIFWF